MTVSTEVTRVIVEGNAITTTFSYSFPIPGSSATDQTNAELILLAADGTTTTLADNLWSITGVQGSSGTFVYNPGSPVTTGNFLTLNRIVPYEQTTVLSAQGAYSPEVVEAALDNLAFQTEQLNTWRLQSLRAPITDAALNDLPTEVLRANRYLAFDINGQATVSGVLNTASGFMIVETQSANTLAPASVLNFVNAVTAVETVSGRVDITVTTPAGGSPNQIEYNSSGNLAGFTMSGDVTVALPGGTASLSTTGASAGTYTNATVTIDNKGRVSTASSGATGAGALILLEQHTAASSASLNFTTGITAAYDDYRLDFIGIAAGTENASFLMRFGTGGGPTWDTSSNYIYGGIVFLSDGTTAGIGNAGATSFELVSSMTTASTASCNGSIYLYGPQSGVGWPGITLGAPNQTGVGLRGRLFFGNYASTASITGVQFLMSSGNIASGVVRLYGMAKS